MSARFQVVQSDAGWFARVWGGSRKVWQSEVYPRRRNALRAIATALEAAGQKPARERINDTDPVSFIFWPFDVREIDEREVAR